MSATSKSSRLRRSGLSLTAITLIASLVGASSSSWAADSVQGDSVRTEAAAKGPQTASVSVAPVRPARDGAAKPPVFRADSPQLPEPAIAVVDLPAGPEGGRLARTTVGGLPLEIASVDAARPSPAPAVRAPKEGGDAPGKVRIDVLRRDEFNDPGALVAMRVTRADGQSAAARIRVQVDYSHFRAAYGGDWSNRLKLIAVPECGLAPRAGTNCAPKALAFANKPAQDSIAATVPLTVDARSGEAKPASAIVMLASGAESATGDFTKTQLSRSASWQQGGASGGFTWSYPVAMPKVPGGLVPTVSLDYSSAAVDGQTAGENVQPGWIGEGWSYDPGFIERSFRSCNQDTNSSPYWSSTTQMSDSCWRMQNAKIVWNGHSTDLIPSDTSTSPNKSFPTTWHLADDDGTKVEYIAGAGSSVTLNWHDEMWKVTTKNGTQYWFGKSFVPGTTTRTNSVLGQSVIGNHSGEPCFSTAGVTESSCAMAYRWNLDYVVDALGNSMVYTYVKEFNKQRVANSQTKTAPYDRAATLSTIDFGLRAGSESTNTAPARVKFSTDDRCFTTSCATHSGANWPDTPWDLNCTAAPCDTPSFWTAKRLTKIDTQILAGAGTGYRTVDSVALNQYFPGTGHGTSPALWLAMLTRTGSDAGPGVSGGEVTLPPIVFYGGPLQNRALFSPTSGAPESWKYRVTGILTETGGKVEVSYSGMDTGCVYPSGAPDPAKNARRCLPQLYEGAWTWWHKYVVDQVVERDLVAGSPTVVHAYQYLTSAVTAGVTVGATDSALWHHDANAFSSPMPGRSWGEWRGYPMVVERTGTGSDGPKTKTARLFFRGMNRDRTDTGDDNRTVKLTDSWGWQFSDEPYRAGQLHETLTYDGDTDTILKKQMYDTIAVAVTGTRTLSSTWATNYPDKAYRIDSDENRTWTLIKSRGQTGWAAYRSGPTSSTTYDAYHNVTAASELGDLDVIGDETCTTTSYNLNAGKYIVDKPKVVQTVGVACSAAPSIPNDVLRGTRFYYDQPGTGTQSLDLPPTAGLTTQAESLRDYSGTTADWIRTWTVVSRDVFGRTISGKDALSQPTTTQYVETNGLTTSMVVTDALDNHLSTQLTPARGKPAAATDANGKTITGEYDALGRLLKVWRTGHPVGGTPDAEYTYSISGETAAPYVQTKALGPDGQQLSSYEILDGLLRARQTQTQAPDGKRVMSDTFYNSSGQVTKSGTYYNADSVPTAAISTATNYNTAVMQQMWYTYDGSGRKLTEALLQGTLRGPQEQSRTSYSYDGDRTTVDQPQGSTDTTTVVDALGRQTQVLQYKASTPTGDADATSYSHDRMGQLTRITDAVGNHWDYTYDLLGRKVRTADPDSGASTSAYDNAGHIVSTKDGRGQVVTTDYDQLGRRTATYADTGAARKQLTAFVYDTVAKGQLTSSTRYVDGVAYSTRATAFDDGYRPLRTETTIPTVPTGSAGENALAGTYVAAMTYRVNGAPATTSLPAVGGLPAEILTSGYNSGGLPTSLTSGAQTYVAETGYTYDGKVATRLLGGEAAKQVSSTYGYDASTRRLTSLFTAKADSSSPGSWIGQAGSQYRYDDAGNLMSIAGSTVAGPADQEQCFRYDYLRRLTAAWTQVSGECATPQKTGADPYWMNWAFDLTGNRKSQIIFGADGAEVSRSTYEYPPAGAAQPHTLRGVTTTGTEAGATAYEYDASGNTLKRPGTGGTDQTLTWDAEGHLSGLSEGSQADGFVYIYDADGARLIRKDPTGAATLTLPDGTELTSNAAGVVAATRHYIHAGTTVATRIASRDAQGNLTGSDKLAWTVGDHHGTGELAVDATTMNVGRRRSLPYGAPLGQQAEGFGSKGFVGGTQDPSGLTHLGAREYDPATGRFISVDPVFVQEDPQSWNGYAYANNSPVTSSDPTGLQRSPDTPRGPLNPDQDPDTALNSPSPLGPCNSACARQRLSNGPNQLLAAVTAQLPDQRLLAMNGSDADCRKVYSPYCVMNGPGAARIYQVENIVGDWRILDPLPGAMFVGQIPIDPQVGGFTGTRTDGLLDATSTTTRLDAKFGLPSKLLPLVTDVGFNYGRDYTHTITNQLLTSLSANYTVKPGAEQAFIAPQISIQWVRHDLYKPRADGKPRDFRGSYWTANWEYTGLAVQQVSRKEANAALNDRGKDPLDLITTWY
ncbi:hypothetical protein OG555_24440 [Kribbella sp. NBC_01484]|uniref:RHS repeat domain-containing protein n=1 Tax=Kribbella sp. NBC_01484 TaxID=2903579 RepID=UPI002E35D451|nr:RHS repeat-associated core domain-containing protein [Kribbella sp. NBC_01484]